MNNNSSKQVLLSVIGVAILVVAVVGVSFAFFSYSVTGEEANTVQTGTIVFTGSSTRMNVTNAFPVAAATADVVEDDTNPNVGYATVSVKGNTTYDSGIDFNVRATNISAGGTYDGKAIKPTVTVDVSTSLPEGVTVTSDHTDGALSGTAEVLAAGKISKNAAEMTTEVPVLTIRAFYDITKYHISDTPETITNMLPAGWDATNGVIVPTDTWNTLSAYSFKIEINAVEGGSARLPGDVA